MKNSIVFPGCLCLVGLFLSMNHSLAGESTNPIQYKGLGYVVVSPQGPSDGGDFGPNTPSSRTSGIQEALQFALENRRDVYIVGGTMPKAFTRGVVYRLNDTLRVPCFQDFRLDGGEYVLDYNHPEGDAVVIDSLMSSRLRFGLIVCHSKGAVVRLKPQTKGPDDFTVITSNTFEFNALVAAGSVFPDGKKAPCGIGLCLDASKGSIVGNHIYCNEVIAASTGVYLTNGKTAAGEGYGIVDNSIEIPILHLCSTHLQVGDENSPSVSKNTFRTNINSEGIEGSIGVRLFGHSNLLTLTFAQTSPGRDILFEATSRDNLLTVANLPHGFTNKATHPTNRIQTAFPMGFMISTPAVPPSGGSVFNREPYTIQVMVTGSGEVTHWWLKDASGVSQEIQSGFTPGQTFLLEPGEEVGLAYTQQPTWKWKAVR